MVRQLEAELDVVLLVRGRRGAQPTEFGRVVLERARRIRAELEAMREDIAMIQGLEVGHASIGVVGTISRWLAPAVVEVLHERAAGVQIRVHEGASERLALEVAEQQLAQAIVTEPLNDPRLNVEHLLNENLVVLARDDVALGAGPVGLAALADHRMILPPTGNPLRAEIDLAALTADVSLSVEVEVEGVRLIADLVASGAGITIIPETAVPVDAHAAGLQAVAIADMPPRRLALVTARGGYLSLADQMLRDIVIELVRLPRAGTSAPKRR
jgi:LysR family nitrogen assimilation transcriptional regulator